MLTLSAAVILLATTPAQAERLTRWEYAELSYRIVASRPAGVDPAGKEVPATEASVTIRWTTGVEEVSVKGWAELAEKLKAPIKKEGSMNFQRLQMLNAIGGEGWELIEKEAPTSGFSGVAVPGARATSSGSSTMLFKRKVR